MFNYTLQVVGYKNSGKTTVVAALVDFLSRQGLKVATVKHDVHGFEWDQKGKDTWQHQEAGAALTLIQSPKQLGFVSNHQEEHSLEKLLQMISQVDQYDMIIIEGYKREAYPKIVLIRNRADFELLNDVQQIKLLLFWREEDQRHYAERVKEGDLAACTALSIQDKKALVTWMNKYFSEVIREREDE